jgi:PAS domain S-box-containing protein
MKSRAQTLLFKTIGIAFSYWVAVAIGKAFSIYTQGETKFPITPFWPAAGIALAAILIFGNEALWGIALGLILSSDLHVLHGSLFIFGGKIIAPFVGAYALRKSGFRNNIDRSRDVLLLLLVGATISPLISATTSTLTHVLINKIVWADFAMHWIVRFLGDALGIAVVVSLVFIVYHRAYDECNTRLKTEAAISLVVVGFLFWLVFSRPVSSQFHELPYAISALILLLLQRFRQSFGVAAIALLTLITCWGTAAGSGPFANDKFFFEIGSLFIFLNTMTICLLMISAVIRERELAETALQASDSDLRSLFSGMRDSVIIFDKDGRYLSIAPTSSATIYKSVEERLGRTLDEIYPNDSAPVLASIRKALDTRQTIETEFPLTLNGNIRWISTTIIPRTEDTVTFIGHDFTARKLALDKVRFQASLLGAVQQAIVAMDHERRFIFWNSYAEKLHGWTEAEVMGRSVLEIAASAGSPPAILAQISGLLNDQVWSGEIMLPHRNGQSIPVLLTTSPVFDDNGKLIGLIGTETDLTERNKLEEQLRQSQKMEAIGKLAGGVAHDFNNLLTAINGYSHVLLPQFPLNDPRRNGINEILMAGERAAELTQQLLAFSRKQILQPKIIDLNHSIKDLQHLLKSSLSENTQLLLMLDPVNCQVKADPGQISQVILNLVVNARDAMPNGGTLLVETQNTCLTQKQADTYGLPAAGNYVRLMVSDTGTGMDAELQTRIFEPFFTTKELGKGTGLGLATVHGIVHQSGGSIQLDSKIGVGTIFSIFLPSITTEALIENKPRQQRLHQSEAELLTAHL